MKILLVDDVPENLELLEDVLTEIGYAAIRARNGVEALEQLKVEPAHLIVADAMMPKMDGFQLCKEVRANPLLAKVPFIIYTGNYIDSADEEFARNIGVDRYLKKTGELDDLVGAINELVQQRYGHRPGRGAAESKERIDDQAFLEQHHAIVIKKLEEKMAELEQYAETLEHKNREIRASEDRYRSLFDHASIAVFVVDRLSGRVLEVNRKGIDLLRYSREELLAMARLPFAERDAVTASIQEAHNYFSGETSMTTKDGEVLDVDVGVGPMTQPEDVRVLLYVRDITEQKKMRAQLLQAEKMGLMGRLAAGIAHEIRNPLSAISLNLQFLIQKFGADPSLRQSAQDALEGAQRVAAVVENTLNLARVSPPVLKQENVNELVTQVMSFIKISIKQKEIRIETSLADGLPPIMVDAKQIQQVVLNIVQNAIDASPEHGTVCLRSVLLEGASRPGQARVAITVRDFGPGIPPEQQKRLFEQFQTTKIGGTGLGLALSKQIMDRHNGEIQISTPDDGGTMVSIAFPIHSV